MTTMERSLIGILTVLGVILLAFWAGQDYGQTQERKAWESRINEERANAAADARQTERDQQAGVNDALRKQNRDLVGINAGLRIDLERLRKRPERSSGVPAGAGSTCTGASGADLSRGDAEFLVRLAARADRIRAALGACYEYADSLKQ